MQSRRCTGFRAGGQRVDTGAHAAQNFDPTRDPRSTGIEQHREEQRGASLWVVHLGRPAGTLVVQPGMRHGCSRRVKAGFRVQFRHAQLLLQRCAVSPGRDKKAAARWAGGDSRWAAAAGPIPSMLQSAPLLCLLPTLPALPHLTHERGSSCPGRSGCARPGHEPPPECRLLEG